jgi:hypothetical protein
MTSKDYLDKRAGAIYYMLPPERDLPLVEIPRYALVIISLERNVGSLVFLSKHTITHDDEWALPLVVGGQQVEFIPKYISDVYTLDRTTKLRPTISNDCVLIDTELSAEKTIRLINEFSQTMADMVVTELVD